MCTSFLLDPSARPPVSDMYNTLYIALKEEMGQGWEWLRERIRKAKRCEHVNTKRKEENDIKSASTRLQK